MKDNDNDYISENLKKSCEPAQIASENLKKLCEPLQIASENLKKLCEPLQIIASENLKKLCEGPLQIIASESFKKLCESQQIILKDINNPLKIMARGFVNEQKLLTEKTKYSAILKHNWAYPFKITPKKVEELNKKNFDEYMLDFFTDKRTKEMFCYINDNLPEHHKMLFKQIEDGYFKEMYALINIAIYPIIDDLLSILCKKTNEKILASIIDWIKQNIQYESFPIIKLSMLSNNIDSIFKFFKFDEEGVYNNEIFPRRHLSLHGKKYSNRKIDSLMLLNTLTQLLYYREFLKRFKLKKTNGSYIIEKVCMRNME